MRKIYVSFFSTICAVLIMSVIAVIVFLSLKDYSSSYSQKNLKEVRETILSHVSQCYALEGRYPPDLDHLEANYGLRFDRDAYIYHYEIFASNIFPDVQVFKKAGE